MAGRFRGAGLGAVGPDAGHRRSLADLAGPPADRAGAGHHAGGVLGVPAPAHHADPAPSAFGLVDGGVYRWSRNPIYVGDLLVLAGLAVGWQSWLGCCWSRRWVRCWNGGSSAARNRFWRRRWASPIGSIRPGSAAGCRRRRC
ncbi:MAG: hypothetical protein JKP98_16895 [Rhodobacteraceae bacterium]|nr:hypothetical protein [Paracoccaceae bacterium]